MKPTRILHVGFEVYILSYVTTTQTLAMIENNSGDYSYYNLKKKKEKERKTSRESCKYKRKINKK